MAGEDDSIDLLAAEYVLGTLDAAERTAVADRRVHDAALDRAIRAWDDRLAPLLEGVGDAAPGAGVLAAVMAKIDDGAAPKPLRAEARRPLVSGSSEVLVLRRRVGRWRAIAGLAVAASVVLAAVVAVKPSLIVPAPAPPDTYVAVFNDGDARPSFLLSIDLTTRQMSIRPIGAGRQPGKDYELWIVSEDLGGASRSLGLLNPAEQWTTRRLSDLTPGLLRRATFGVSLEPVGGSPTGRPTGPALHGTLLPVDNDSGGEK